MFGFLVPVRDFDARYLMKELRPERVLLVIRIWSPIDNFITSHRIERLDVMPQKILDHVIKRVTRNLHVATN